MEELLAEYPAEYRDAARGFLAGVASAGLLEAPERRTQEVLT